ncbi:acireductone synthase [Archangium gephyra]|uniref:Enolase-phosphatase E1 n=1 Tax=Archangium gephyra TaxID=48 RepID=A0AAC8TBC5_9BACT|nr:acireductone synthase [Archangium gephyra]AKI99502.1 2,3-diketo-5-methylthiopentyl-1-phosphate enolase-phosphatase [Archangium gephyra]REG27955.1 acireductone synthase [Archangium gephyra]
MTQAIVTDIEGTTSSLSFVKEVLFPYAARELPGFVRAHGQRPEVRHLLDEARQLAGGALDDARLVATLLRWMDEDRKFGPLKGLQGLMWEAGYRQGDFQGHVYEDVPRVLREWRERGLRLYVYSSGSVHAQTLLFGHTRFGDLTPLFSGYFDTGVGGKKETASYASIVQELALPAGQVLFLSDVRAELDAAAAAGLRTVCLVRGEGPEVDPGPHPVARSFDDVQP